MLDLQPSASQSEYDEAGQYLEQEEVDESPFSESVSAIAIDFDRVTNDPDKSRADEIRVLTIKNKKQPKHSKERKPPGIAVPTGGEESGETLIRAVVRETVGESGYTAGKVFGELFCEHKNHVRNNVHVFLVEADSTYVVPVKERDEVDQSYDNWITLREFFQLPYAIAKDGTPLDPNGIYYAHVRRLVKALNSLIFADCNDPNLPPDMKEAIERLPQKAFAWTKEHAEDLLSAMEDLLKDDLIKVSENGLVVQRGE